MAAKDVVTRALCCFLVGRVGVIRSVLVCGIEDEERNGCEKRRIEESDRRRRRGSGAVGTEQRGRGRGLDLPNATAD